MKKYLRHAVRRILAEGPFVTASGETVEYGTQEHVDDLKKTLDDLIRVRNRQPRTSKARYIYARAVEETRKKMRKAKRFGIRNGLIEEIKLAKYVRAILMEGGLKAPELTSSTLLDPQTVSVAIDVYNQVIDLWNQDLQQRGLRPVESVGPVGSVAYYKKDLESNPAKKYGDVDYLVAFPVVVPDDATPEEERAAENAVAREYTTHLIEFLKSSSQVQSLVNVPATIKSSPTLLIVKLPDGQHVQVDTIITYPHYVEKEGRGGWMPSRWTPERGLKGYTAGELYSTLGDRFNLSITDRGVLARTRDGESVPFRMRKNTKLHRISKNISTVFADIADYLAPGAELDPILEKQPGMNPKSITIKSLARGIKGLMRTLEQAGVVDDASSELQSIVDAYAARLRNAIERKRKRGLDDDKYEKMQALNEKVVDIVEKEFVS